MTKIYFHTSDRDKVCRICEDKIVRNTYSLVMEGIRVSPKTVDLFFHEGCVSRALDYAKETRSLIV